MKYCFQCKTKKITSEFSKRKKSSDGLQTICKKCRSNNHFEKQLTSYGRAYQLVSDAKKRALKRERDFNVELENIQAIIEEGTCQLTGLKFDLSPGQNGRQNAYAPSIDRIDSKKGYTKENTRVVLWAVNSALHDHGESVMLPILEAIVKGIKKNVKKNTTAPIPVKHNRKSKNST